MQMRHWTVGGRAAYGYRIRFLVGAVLVALLPAAVPALAQDQQGTLPPWLDVTIVRVTAGKQAEFEDMVKKLTMASNKANQPVVGVYQVVEGREGVYHVLMGHAKLAEKDNPPPPPLKPDEMAGVMGRLLPTLAEGHTFLARTFPQFANTGEKDAQTKYLLLRTVRVSVSRTDDFIKWIETDLMPAIKKAKLGLTVSEGVFGDSPQNFYFATPIIDYAAFDGPDPVQASMSPKAYQQMFDKLKGITESQEMTLLRMRTDLSSPTE